MSLSIIIPSRNERFLQQTIKDVLRNVTGEIELFAMLNDHTEPLVEIDDERVKYRRLKSENGETLKRQCINQAVEEANGKYIMWLDAHCLIAKGMDEQLIKDHHDDWVQIPRRNRLDAEKWCLQTQVDKRPPIDYEYTMFPLKFDPHGLHGFKWDERTLTKWDIPIDETMHFQGSCVFMTKEYFKYLGLMQIEGYSGWGQEAEEVSFKVRRAGGKVITNKNTYYAHLHKGPKYGRMYYMSRESMRACNRFSYQHWVHDNKDLFIKYIEQFYPLPGWENNWKEKIYG
jgi:glycosyltransferase involved in cell wall biosynthesis